MISGGPKRGLLFIGDVMDDQAELRRRYKAWSKAQREGRRPPIDPAFQDLRCGAKTRAGTPCKRRDLWDSGRCKLHGGLSTGPKSGPRARKAKPVTPKDPDEYAHNRRLEEIINSQIRRARVI